MLRRRLVVGSMAFAFLFLTSVELSYAQPAASGEVELLVSAPTTEELKQRYRLLTNRPGRPCLK